MVKLPFIVLAGSPIVKDSLLKEMDVPFKALIDVNGRTMIDRVLHAINNSNYASQVLITGLPKEFVRIPSDLKDLEIDILEVRGKQVEKIHQSALFFLNYKEQERVFPSGSTHAIVITSDIPTITGELIENFINICGDRSSSFYEPVVEKSVMDAKFPNNGRSYIRVDGRQFCTGDISLVELSKVPQSLDIIKKVTDNRKNFLKALLIASPLTFVKYLLKRVKIKDVERLMTKIFKVESRLIISEFAEIAFDVDKPFQLDIATNYIRSREI